MILITRKNLSSLLYFFLSMNFSYDLCNAYYNFKVEYINHISWVLYHQGVQEIPTKGFKLPWNNDTNELKGICAAAKEHTAFGVTQFLRDGSIDLFGPKPAHIVEEGKAMNNAGPFMWVMLCKTRPSIWLRAGDLYNEIIIMMEKKDCNLDTQLYKFHVERINFKPMPIPLDNPVNEVLMKQDNRLQAEVGACAWWYICEVAKKYAETLTPTKLKNDRITRQVLEFSTNNGKEKHVTLTCSSEPMIYAYLGVSMYDVEIKILF